MVKYKAVKKVAGRMGVDKAIFYTSLSKIVQGFGGIVSVILIATCLTGVEQGFYYTFGSILAIQVFFELGLGGIITQFVAHEKSHLIEEKNKITGEEKYISRLSYLLRFCLKWYSILAIGLFFVILIIGFVFFSYFYKSDVYVNWKFPWILLVFGTVINFLLAPISAFLEGLGKVKEIAFIRFLQQLLSMSLIWLGLFFGFKLFVVVVAPFITAILLLYFFWKKFGKLLFFIFQHPVSEKISYKKEIFPYQWKIALSWISGYFIFQLFNPILFAFEGPIVAGQMGMTISALNTILGLSISWITTKIPIFSNLIAQKQYKPLDTLFHRTLIQSIAINTLGMIGFFIILVGIRYFNIEINGKSLGVRFLPFLPLMMMFVAFLVNQFIFAWATYLRCHKKEPMMTQSVVMGILSSFSSFFLCKYFGILGMTSGYALLCIFGFIWTFFVFKTHKKIWHHE